MFIALYCHKIAFLPIKINMCDVERAADSYFRNLNATSRIFCRDLDNFRTSYGAEWDEFSDERREELIDNYALGPEIREKYNSYPQQEVEECFPQLKIKSGEKIVVDFDNEDGWTWQDEHSGPFSWKTKSQQDLSLWNDTPPQTKNPEASKPTKMPRKSHSADRDALNANLAYKPEKSIWDSPFLVGEKGMVQSDSDIFEQLGINFNAAREASASRDVRSVSPQESAKAEDDNLLASPEHTNKAFTMNEPEEESATSTTDSSRQSSMSPPESPAVRKLSGKNKAGRWWPGRHSKAEAEQSLMSELSLSVSSQDSPGGQLSPVYIEDPGESTTDDVGHQVTAEDKVNKNMKSSNQNMCSTQPTVTNQHTTNTQSSTTAASVVSTQPQAITTQPLKAPLSSMDEDDIDDEDDGDWLADSSSGLTGLGKMTDSSSDAAKTGFDFLDNW